MLPSPLAEKKEIESDSSAGGRGDRKDETSSKSTSGDVLPENSANHPDGGIHNIITSGTEPTRLSSSVHSVFLTMRGRAPLVFRDFLVPDGKI